MFLLIIILPLFGAITSGFFGRYLGSKGSNLISCICVCLSAVLSIMAFYEVGIINYVCHIKLISWFNSGLFIVSWGFLFDSLTVTILIVVTIIASLVHIYSIEYIKEDPHQPRFISYLSIFTFFILILVTADNFIQIFLGWEGVGLASYLLINFWFTRLAANKAAIKAIIINRIGDFGLSLGILLIFYKFNSVEYITVFLNISNVQHDILNILGFKINTITLICLLLFIGSMGKSAQLGLHTWLPDAIEGPTPVSALIHAATMVTAGVFLIVRCSPIFEFSSTSLSFITLVGGLTAVFGATTGMFQNDLKKVIAYSTCSQLGYMMFSCGTSNYIVGIFHLFNHAFFKALLFLSAGAVIHSLSDEQDIRRIGGLRHILPFIYVVIFIGSISLIGFPFITGFYSKDLILELTYVTYSISGNFVYWLGIISAIFTAFYSFKLLFLSFLSFSNSLRINVFNIHEPILWITLVILFLAFSSVFLGFLIKDMFVGLGTDFWSGSVFLQLNNMNLIESEFVLSFIKWMPFLFSIMGVTLVFVIHYFFNYKYVVLQLKNKFRYIVFFFNKKWCFDKIYNNIARYIINFGYFISFKILDKGILEILGPYGLIKIIPFYSIKIKSLQTGQMAHYIFIILISLISIFTFIELWDFLLLIINIKTLIVLLLSLFLII